MEWICKTGSASFWLIRGMLHFQICTPDNFLSYLTETRMITFIKMKDERWSDEYWQV